MHGRPTNLWVNDLNKISDAAINPSVLREALGDYVKKGETRALSVAAGSINVDDNVQYVLSVSGKNLRGNSPSVVEIGGVRYTIVKTDTKSVPSVMNGNGGVTNFNHAEQKLMSYFQDAYSGKKATISIGVENTSALKPGMCSGCSISSAIFAEKNPSFDIRMFHGTTGINP